jgi:hypothetical protein
VGNAPAIPVPLIFMFTSMNFCILRTSNTEAFRLARQKKFPHIVHKYRTRNNLLVTGTRLTDVDHSVEEFALLVGLVGVVVGLGHLIL